MTSVPVAVGFGVATPEDAAQVGEVADGVIVGTAIVRQVEAHLHDGTMAEQVGRFVGALKAALTRNAVA
jgi:tryptophan synthase alpha chain